MSTASRTIADAWIRHAPALAAWVNKHMVNRRDAYGGYYAKDGTTRQTTRKVADGAPPLSIATLIRHFKAAATDDVIGLHAIGIDEDGNCTTRAITIDIDRHGDDGDPEANFRAALAWYEVAVALGFTPLLFDSNGRGGYHLVLIFSGPIPTALAFAFARWLIRDWEDRGLASPPECFPKQVEIARDKFGNWARLPGRHHTRRDHYTRVWSGSQWLIGRDAIKVIVKTEGTPASAIPDEARPDPDATFDLGREIERKRAGLEGGPRRPAAEDGTLEPGEDFNLRSSWSDILVGWVLDHEDEGTGFWRRRGKAAGQSATTNHNGNDTLYVFTDATAFQQHGSFSKFGAYTVTNHAGDFKKATVALSRDGFGTFLAWVWYEESGEWSQEPEVRPNPCPKGGWVIIAKPGKARPTRPPKGSAHPKVGTNGQAHANGQAEAEAGDTTEHRSSGRPDTRLEVIVSTDEFAVNDHAIAALSTDPEVYCRGNFLVTVQRDAASTRLITRPAESPRIAAMQRASIRERLAKNARWSKWRKDEKTKEFVLVPAHPPDWTTAAIEARGHWPGMRPLEGVIETPIIRPDGSILDRPGYDALTGLLYEPNCDFPPIPAAISREDARAAAGLILDVVADFPFAVIRDEEAGTDDGGEGHRAAYLAGLLTPLARYAIAGPCPLFLADANTAASGKTKLCDIVAILATGREAARTAYPESDEEMRKQILAIAIEGDRLMLLDNVATGAALGGAALDGVLTGTTVKGRLLGRSQMSREIPIYTVWYATGNNLGLKGDALRRVVSYRLESEYERPEERDDFRIKGDLLKHVKARRGELVVAALTILRGYVLADRPQAALTPMDYPAWCGIVRQAIYWATGIDPCVTRKGMIAEDPETNAIKGLISGWAELPGGSTGLTTAAVVKILTNKDHLEKYQTLRDVLLEWSRDGEIPGPRSIGIRLKMIKGKVIDGKSLKSKSYGGTQSWRVVESSVFGTVGTVGTSSNPRGKKPESKPESKTDGSSPDFRANGREESQQSQQSQKNDSPDPSTEQRRATVRAWPVRWYDRYADLAGQLSQQGHKFPADEIEAFRRVSAEKAEAERTGNLFSNGRAI